MSTIKGDHNMSAVKMPSKFFPFIGRNKKIGEIVGMGIIQIDHHEIEIKAIKTALRNTDILAMGLEDGTREELEEFMSAINNGEYQIQTFEGLTEDTVDEIRKELHEATGGRVHETIIKA